MHPTLEPRHPSPPPLRPPIVTKMSEATIRPFQASDQKAARFYISKGRMEGLTAANIKVYTNFFVVGLWIALSSTLIQYMNWWPRPEQGYLGYLSPIPAFACMALPIMFGTDWYNRPAFEESMQDALHSVDLADTAAYYSRSPASGFWILEYNGRFVGLIAVDASTDSASGDIPLSSDDQKSKLTAKGTSSLATIRHFYVEEPYRSTLVQDDLLKCALKFAFQEKKVQRVKALDAELTSYLGKSLRRQGFSGGSLVETVGVFGWSVHERVLDRKTYEKNHQA